MPPQRKAATPASEASYPHRDHVGLHRRSTKQGAGRGLAGRGGIRATTVSPPHRSPIGMGRDSTRMAGRGLYRGRQLPLLLLFQAPRSASHRGKQEEVEGWLGVWSCLLCPLAAASTASAA